MQKYQLKIDSKNCENLIFFLTAVMNSTIEVPFCDEKSVQLFRVAFFRSDFLQNPYFSLWVKVNPPFYPI